MKIRVSRQITKFAQKTSQKSNIILQIKFRKQSPLTVSQLKSIMINYELSEDDQFKYNIEYDPSSSQSIRKSSFELICPKNEKQVKTNNNDSWDDLAYKKYQSNSDQECDNQFFNIFALCQGLNVSPPVQQLSNIFVVFQNTLTTANNQGEIYVNQQIQTQNYLTLTPNKTHTSGRNTCCSSPISAPQTENYQIEEQFFSPFTKNTDQKLFLCDFSKKSCLSSSCNSDEEESSFLSNNYQAKNQRKVRLTPQVNKIWNMIYDGSLDKHFSFTNPNPSYEETSGLITIFQQDEL